jgi:adenine-specific DNA glycosylase
MTIEVKGVGEYTAAAIASFLIMKWSRCRRKCVSVLSRYFDVETDIASFRKKRIATGFRMPKDILLL